MPEKPVSEQIDDIITKHAGWKGELLTDLRQVVLDADPTITEEIKWRMATRPEGLPVWSHNRIICFAEMWKDNVKLLFPKGAQLQDRHKAFNARLKSKAIRAIEYKEGDKVEPDSLKELVQQAAKANETKNKPS